ncbi:amino acid-binding protein [bacterium]|nr:amino acid-binding protein [bacterium]MBR5624373.1 amino acid-binding protein [bacterium]
METVKQLSLFLENKPGHVYSICKALGDAGINIYTLTLADTAQFGILRLIVEDAESSKALLEKEGFIVNIADVLAVRIDNQPGRLAQVAEILNKEGINVEYVYAFANRHIFLYRVDDTEKAYQKLISNGFCVLSSHELFNTNK